MNVLKSADEPAITVPPKLASCALILGSASPALISRFSLSMIGAGVLRGAARPFHVLASEPGTISPTVGTSGRISDRVAVLTASACSLPVLTYSIEDGIGSNVTCTRPPIRSASAGGTPRYDTCTRSTPAMILNSSPQTCWIDPGPADAMLISPGCALA